MADVWKEDNRPKRKGGAAPPSRKVHMWGFPVPPELPLSLGKNETWFVRVCSFTFEFRSIEQLEACLEYYSRKVRPSSLIPAKDFLNYGGDSGEVQRWFERLPMYLLEEPKRKKVIAALERARTEWQREFKK